MTGKILAAAIGGVVWLACSPTEPCACPPSRTHVVVHGFAVDQQGSPVQAEVFVKASNRGCLDQGPGGPIEGPLTTGNAGEYEARVFSAYGPHDACVTVTGVRTVNGAQDTAVVTGVYVAMVHEKAEPERLRVDLLF